MAVVDEDASDAAPEATCNANRSHAQLLLNPALGFELLDFDFVDVDSVCECDLHLFARTERVDESEFLGLRAEIDASLGVACRFGVDVTAIDDRLDELVVPLVEQSLPVLAFVLA
jgi:hypothetical protein